MRATLVVPTLNEAASIGHVIRSFRTAADAANARLFPRDPLDWEILVVDGRSSDGTADLARAEGANVLLETRPGYGRAYRSGLAAATGDLIATADGDATYPVEEVPRLARQLLDEGLDFVSGDRLTRVSREAMTTEHRIGNWVLNQFVHIAYHTFFREVPGQTLRDSQSGMWIFRRSILPSLRLTQDGMAFSEELKLEVVLRGFRFLEVPIDYKERWGAPKLSSWRDGRRNLQFLFEKRLEVAKEIKFGVLPVFAPRKVKTPR
jgi:dolichol-phosphate hexosyltransferase